MSDFEVKTYNAKIIPHPNADLIEICQIGDYQSIVQKNTIHDGDVVAYIPEASIVPDALLEKMGLTGKLAGKAKNRVKAIRLRKVLSQGLVYPMPGPVGRDVQEELGIIKYEPPVPQELRGRTLGSMYGKTLSYPMHNVKLYGDELEEGETVVITEKLHGTWCCCGVWSDGTPIVTSKGLSSKGIVLDPEDANVYSNVWRNIQPTVQAIQNEVNRSAMWNGSPFYILGEIFGRGIQDLQYNLMTPEFRVFDIFIGEPTTGRYLEISEVLYLLDLVRPALMTVPILYNGPYSKEVVLEYTTGQSTLGGNVREGVVVKPTPERLNSKGGRLILKSISEDYLLRKGGTEHN